MVAVPDYLAKTSAPAYYEPGTPDGSRPGRLFIDTYDATNRNLYSVEAIAYHEGIPGHHLQISIAQELTDIPEFRKYSQLHGVMLRVGASTPSSWAKMSASTRIRTPIMGGWRTTSGAPFALSSTPASTPKAGPASRWWTTSTTTRIGRAKHPGRSRSLHCMAQPGAGLQDRTVEDSGATRQSAKGAWRPKFDIRAFHDQVIDSGALPLDVLEQRIEAWIAAQKGAAASAGQLGLARGEESKAPGVIFFRVPNDGGLVPPQFCCRCPERAAREDCMKRCLILAGLILGFGVGVRRAGDGYHRVRCREEPRIV